MNYLVTFPDGYSTLFADKAEAEKCTERWSHDPPTIRDLDQEARDREEACDLLREAMCWLEDASAYAQDDARDFDARAEALLKRLGRLP